MRMLYQKKLNRLLQHLELMAKELDMAKEDILDIQKNLDKRSEDKKENSD